MGTVAFLPKELSGAEEHACTHFPTHHVGPLVAQHGQVAVRVYPIFICAPDDGFGSGAYDQLLLKTGIGVDNHAGAVGVVFQTIVGYYGTFFGKAFDVLSLTTKERLGYEQREVGILHAGLLEHFVKSALHLFPDGVTIGLYYHTSSYSRLFCEVSLNHEIVIPL